MDFSKTIIVSAVNIVEGGALSIYKDFINFVKSYDDKRLYYVFTSVNEFSDSEFIKFIYMNNNELEVLDGYCL